MKKLILGVFFALLFAGTAFAAEREFDVYVIDVPAGWADAINEDGRLTLTAPDGVNNLWIGVAYNPFYEPIGVVEFMSSQRGGTPPESAGPGYYFQATIEQGFVTWYVYSLMKPGDPSQIVILNVIMEGDLAVLLPVAQSIRLK